MLPSGILHSTMEGWGPSHWEPQVIGGVYGCNFSDCELGSFEPLRAGDLNDRFSFSRPGVLMEYLRRKACIICIVYFHYWVFAFAFFRQTVVEPVLWFHMITVHQWQDFGGTCSTITYDYILYIVYQSYSCTDISSRYHPDANLLISWKECAVTGLFPKPTLRWKRYMMWCWWWEFMVQT